MTNVNFVCSYFGKFTSQANLRKLCFKVIGLLLKQPITKLDLDTVNLYITALGGFNKFDGDGTSLVSECRKQTHKTWYIFEHPHLNLALFKDLLRSLKHDGVNIFIIFQKKNSAFILQPAIPDQMSVHFLRRKMPISSAHRQD